MVRRRRIANQLLAGGAALIPPQAGHRFFTNPRFLNTLIF
jgi:hypothetical protein